MWRQVTSLISGKLLNKIKGNIYKSLIIIKLAMSHVLIITDVIYLDLITIETFLIMILQ